jgi:hypothetical protein
MKLRVPAAGLAAITAGALVVASSPAPQPEPSATRTSAVQLLAKAQSLPVDGPSLVSALAAVQRIADPPDVSVTAAPAPQVAANLVAFPGLANAIIATYSAIEPWVAYGVSLAQYAVGWIPGVGFLAPQIGIFYNLGESIVASAVFNVADVIGGQSIVAAVSDFINESIAAGVTFVNAEIAWALSFLPPLPFPPFPFAEESADAELMMAASDDEVPEEAKLTDEPVVDDASTGESSIEKVVTEEAVTETDPTTTDSSGPIQAQGEIRGSDDQSPDAAAGEGTETAPTGETDETEEPEDKVTPSLEPSTNDDEAGTDTAEADDAESPKDE